MPKHPEAELHAVREEVRHRACDTGRVFRRSDLVEWGLPADIVIPMMRRTWWVRLHHGIYADARDTGSDPDGRDMHLLRLAASIRALPEPAFAFGPSAALLHDLALPSGIIDDVHLVRPLGRDGRALARRISAVDRLRPAVVRTHPLSPHVLTTVAGIPTVTRDLAAVSAAVECSPDWAVALLDSAAWQRPDLIEQMEGHASRLQHLAGIGVVRSVLAHVRSGAQSALESHSRVRLVRCGLPEPRLQVPFHDREGLIGVVDMYFEELGVIGEADGAVKYLTGADLLAEKRREDRLRRQHPVVRWDWATIWRDPKAVAGQIRDAARWRWVG